MLEILRKKGVNKTILWIIAVIIILSFGVFGTAYLFNNSVDSVGTMYGRNVSSADFRQTLQDARDQYIMRYGDEFLKVEGKVDLEPTAWDNLVLLKEAQKRDIRVSDQEVVAYIAALPFLQNNGQFDQMLYDKIVQNIFERSTHDFEEFIRKQLTIKKLVATVVPEVTLSDAQLKIKYQKLNEKITLEYVLFSALDFSKNSKAGDDEIKKYFADHKEDFRLPASIVLNYVETKDKATADALSKELTPASDFAAMAKTLKLDVKTSVSFTQEQPVAPFASNPPIIQKFFEMKPGDYSPPLQIGDGWQIVRLKEKHDAAIPALQDAKDKVKDAVLLQKGFSLAKQQADKSLVALTEALKTHDFKTAATGLGLKVQETPVFGRQENIVNGGLVQEFQQEADGLNTDKRLSGVIATIQGPAIIYLEKVQEPADKQFESDKKDFRKTLSDEERNQAIITFMVQLRAKADIKSKIKQP